LLGIDILLRAHPGIYTDEAGKQGSAIAKVLVERRG
jgi:hypothetical protein